MKDDDNDNPDGRPPPEGQTPQPLGDPDKVKGLSLKAIAVHCVMSIVKDVYFAEDLEETKLLCSAAARLIARTPSAINGLIRAYLTDSYGVDQLAFVVVRKLGIRGVGCLGLLLDAYRRGCCQFKQALSTIVKLAPQEAMAKLREIVIAHPDSWRTIGKLLGEVCDCLGYPGFVYEEAFCGASPPEEEVARTNDEDRDDEEQYKPTEWDNFLSDRDNTATRVAVELHVLGEVKQWLHDDHAALRAAALVALGLSNDPTFDLVPAIQQALTSSDRCVQVAGVALCSLRAFSNRDRCRLGLSTLAPMLRSAWGGLCMDAILELAGVIPFHVERELASAFASPLVDELFNELKELLAAGTPQEAMTAAQCLSHAGAKKTDAIDVLVATKKACRGRPEVTYAIGLALHEMDWQRFAKPRKPKVAKEKV